MIIKNQSFYIFQVILFIALQLTQTAAYTLDPQDEEGSGVVRVVVTQQPTAYSMFTASFSAPNTNQLLGFWVIVTRRAIVWAAAAGASIFLLVHL